MMPFVYPIHPVPFPILVIANSIRRDENENVLPLRSIPMANLHRNDETHALPSMNHHDAFCLRLNVDGFRPEELNISIRHGRLIVRGKHVVRASIPPITTDSIVNERDDFEPDFVAKEFKRTFSLPPNVDIRKTRAQFYSQQQLLVIEIPFQTSTDSLEIRRHFRPIDIFLAIVAILFINQTFRQTHEHQEILIDV